MALPLRRLLLSFDGSEPARAAAATFAGPTETRLLEGEPAEAVAAEADRIGADVIVIGARGRSPLAGLLLGSTARSLLRATRRPTWVAHGPAEAVRRVVAGVEAGGEALRVAEAAGAVAAVTGGAVTLVNVVDADPALVAHPERFGIPEEVWRESLAKHAERVFGGVRAAVPGAGEVLRYGRAATEIREAAEALDADLVVVARRGRSGLDVDAWASVAFALAVRGPFATLVV